MSKITVPGNLKPTTDFFEYNPEVRYVGFVSRMVNKLGKDVASKYLWGIYMAHDPDSSFYHMDLKERQDHISKYFIKEHGFSWDDISRYVDSYVEFIMPKSKRRFYKIESILDSTIDDAASGDADNAIKLLSKLGVIYKGKDLAEKEYNIDKERSADTRGEQKSGFFAG